MGEKASNSRKLSIMANPVVKGLMTKYDEYTLRGLIVRINTNVDVYHDMEMYEYLHEAEEDLRTLATSIGKTVDEISY